MWGIFPSAPFRNFHWLPVVARIRFKMFVLANKAVNGTAPAYLEAVVRPHTPARALPQLDTWYRHR